MSFGSVTVHSNIAASFLIESELVQTISAGCRTIFGYQEAGGSRIELRASWGLLSAGRVLAGSVDGSQ